MKNQKGDELPARKKFKKATSKLPRQISALEPHLEAVSNKLKNGNLDSTDSDSKSEEPMKEPADNASHLALTRQKKKPKN